MDTYNKGLFANWVPKNLTYLLIGLITLPIITIAGVYTSVATNIASEMAVYTEYITLASNASTIGMGVAFPIVLRLKARFRTKEIITFSAIILSLLSFMCGTTDSPIVLLICSLLIGFFKTLIMIEMLLPLMVIISPGGNRGIFYSVFYPISIGFGQITGYYFAELVYDGNWQSPYFLMSAIMLIVALISIVFQHNQRFAFKMPLHQIDWLSLVLLCASFMCFNYFFVFMKQQAWFTSKFIIASGILGIIFLALLFYRQRFLKRKLIDAVAFSRKNVLHAAVLLICMGVYLAVTTVYTQYTMGVLGYSYFTNASSNLWMLPGIIIAGGLAYLGFKNKWYIKYFIASGFACLFLHTLSLYLIIQPQMDIRYLEYSLILKGMGMTILYIGIWFYACLNLSMNQLLGMMTILIMVRSFLATAMGSALLGWASYQAQWQSLSDLSNYLDIGVIGDSMSSYKTMSVNAMLSSWKIVLGSLCWFIVPIMLYISTHKYGKFYYRRMVLLRKRIRGNSTKGFKLS